MQNKQKSTNGTSGKSFAHRSEQKVCIYSVSLQYDKDLCTMNRRIALLLLIFLPVFFSCTEKEQEIRVESVTISLPSAELEIGRTLELSATVTPPGATNKDISWSSTNSSVASVSAAGLVTALSEGTTTITASADGKKGECKVSVVKVPIMVTEVKLDKAELTLYECDEETLTATVLPDDATDKTVTWTSSDNSIATIESGKVKAVKKGEATITAKAGDKTAKAKIVVLTPISGVSLNKDKLTLYIGETETLTATLTPAEATLKDPISWTSSDEAVATIADGKITTVGKGTAKITATAYGKSASCDIEVLRPVTGISLNKTTLEIPLEKTETLTASIIPADATPRGEITWLSSDTQIATVDAGKVTALSMGSTTVTASLEGFKAECNVTVKGMEYGKIAITAVRPVDILPVIGQVLAINGDPNVYDNFERLRLAEATRIRDMMWEYGAGDISKEEYRKLMGRLNTGMTHEFPLGYDYEYWGPTNYYSTPSNHAHCEWFILSTLVPYTNMVIPFISSSGERQMLEYVRANPNTINIFGQSSSEADILTKEQYDHIFRDIHGIKGGCFELYESKNYIHFAAGTNIKYKNPGTEDQQPWLIKIYNGDYEADEKGEYSVCSMANSDKNTRPGSHLLVTIATDKSGHIHVDEKPITGTKFPVGFADNVLFAGRPFPYHSLTSGEILASYSKPNTSFPNYVNVALMDICFQLYAEVKDVDELLEMVRSTALTDYVSFGGKTQPLILINHAGFIKKYLMPKETQITIGMGETLSLEKGYYKGVLFAIPGAEVKVNGEWVAFDSRNKDVIMSQNPINLEWRLNGELLKRYGYTPGQTVEGQIITVDDKWGGLRLEVPISVRVQ